MSTPIFKKEHPTKTNHVHRYHHWLTNTYVQSTAFFLLLGIFLYTFLFSTYPPIHDAVHELRHSLWIIPCH
ncbi:CbtB domain-containing protein [Marininema halotolerans]|uniref:Probable cobalt transporter subunit (CbtB) n=1 Tax=Marininema halotolerans TaxID=1155944 RepID=A0A1I6RXG9_9BACL|nr:CbtB-domain containing protein [Marininema halotolerans]SFS69290.1 Probable cobalt transporter subunit (CbtB) [Marininema halotolerans]